MTCTPIGAKFGSEVWVVPFSTLSIAGPATRVRGEDYCAQLPGTNQQQSLFQLLQRYSQNVVDCRNREGGVSLGYVYSQNGKKPSKAHAMYKITTNDEEGQVSETTQSLDELARQGARRMILAALELEVEQYVRALRHWRDEPGHAMVLRNGKARHCLEPHRRHAPAPDPDSPPEVLR